MREGIRQKIGKDTENAAWPDEDHAAQAIKECQVNSFGGKKSVKGNRQGVLSRSITRRSGRIAKSCCKI